MIVLTFFGSPAKGNDHGNVVDIRGFSQSQSIVM
ncbi:unnamed protein product [Onchocerca flexuosa]|uniref:Transposase n=1 Tax=Onchocerca flexuosa TaxID=387005 RepID=A0A183HUR3_9BILA|nr:unnamed protein product [Onchocerca flexuosa]